MTSSERAQRLAELVKAAIERGPEERSAFLDKECEADPAMRAEIESLLEQQDGSSRFIEEPALHLAAESLTREGAFRAGQTIGEYEIVSLIGTGGMGEVYLAQDRQLHRKVALKLIRRGMDSEDIIRHFKREEHLLASLNHPNIAQLYGGGVSVDGIPFFAMEYVEGQWLDEYCDEHGLGTKERLQLFRKVCAAVTYAHQHLVIHRDLKPANIRVTPEGEPKLLDFGIAKLLDVDNAPSSGQTLTLQGVMTPEYASPEQIRGETMTTTSDIYSLGVVLYRLLTGQSPYRTKTNRPDEIARAITEQEPTRPSTAVKDRDSRSENRDSVDSRFTLHDSRPLRGDLDNIILMALRKEPSRRYSSVGQFSADIQRHLDGLPVIAREDTFQYRSAKFIKRHRVGVAAAILVALTLVGGVIATTWEARRANYERIRAERRFDEVRRLANSLMFEIHDSVQDLQGSTPTRRLIVSRALEYLDSLAQDEGSKPSLQRELAIAYQKIGDIQGNPYSANLGDTDGALASYRKALAIRERLSTTLPGTETEMEKGITYRALGDILEQKGDIVGMVQYYRSSFALFERLSQSDPSNAVVKDELARSLEALGDGLGRDDTAAAERLQAYQRTLALRQRLLELKPSDRKLQRGVAVSFLKIADAAGANKALAIESVRQAIQVLEALAAADPNNARARREVGMAHHFAGSVYTQAGDFTAALESARKALAIRQEIAAQDPKNQQARFDLAAEYGNLCDDYGSANQPDQAHEPGERSLEILKELEVADPTNAVYTRNIGLCYQYMAKAHARAGIDERRRIAERVKEWAKARACYQKASDVFTNLRNRGTLMPLDQGRPEEFGAKLSECQEAINRLNSLGEAQRH